jgi:hypothetical protein
MITREKLENHIKHLQEKHDLLDAKITESYKNYKSDTEVEDLKKSKLHLRDEIEKLKHQILTLN